MDDNRKKKTLPVVVEFPVRLRRLTFRFGYCTEGKNGYAYKRVESLFPSPRDGVNR